MCDSAEATTEAISDPTALKRLTNLHQSEQHVHINCLYMLFKGGKFQQAQLFKKAQLLHLYYTTIFLRCLNDRAIDKDNG